ncbi:MAG: DUF3576 domain-containing protein [Gluconacetobacter diazotrophicus]|nr:DUF3576 domain-containing protein [Gluconacetobacter diazotrophicus]
MLLATMLAACGDSDKMVNTDTTALATPGGEKHLNGDSGDSNTASAGVNAYLWRGAIDTLSFMPFASAEPAGGIIITDWYSPPTTSNERFKANAYILGPRLRSDEIRVSVFRQVRQDGQWVDAAVAPNTATDIASRILTRARQLKTASGGGAS